MRELHSSDSGPCPEGLFYFWLACGQLREAARFLHDQYQSRVIKEFIDQLPEDARKHWGSLQNSFEPWAGSFVEAILRRIRDSVFHYPKVGEPDAEQVLASLATLESGIRVGAGERVADIRCVFADELRAKLLSSYLGADLQGIRQHMERVAGLTVALISFARSALEAYLDRLPNGVVRLDG